MLKYLIIKEFKQLFRNSFMPKLFLIMPLAMIGIFPWAANQEIKGLKIAIVDNDKSSISMKLIQKIEASKYYTITSYVQTHDQAMKSIEEGKADVIVEIPINFEKNLIRQGAQTINISANSINGIKGTMGNSYLIGIINDFTSSLKTYQTKIMAEGQTAQTFTIKTILPF
jgi:ABC-2 type transport system permease protein